MMADCRFWDYHSGNRFQEEQVKVQPGSLESEAGVNCMTFDQSGTRLITGEVDKTIKRKPQIKHIPGQCARFSNSATAQAALLQGFARNLRCRSGAD